MFFLPCSFKPAVNGGGTNGRQLTFDFFIKLQFITTNQRLIIFLKNRRQPNAARIIQQFPDFFHRRQSIDIVFFLPALASGVYHLIIVITSSQDGNGVFPVIAGIGAEFI